MDTIVVPNEIAKTPHPGMEYGDWVTNWWWPAACTKFSETTQANYRTTLNRLIIPFFEVDKVCDIRTSSIKAWVSHLQEVGYKPSVIDSAIRVFRATMTAAMVKGLVDSNPLAGVKAS